MIIDVSIAYNGVSITIKSEVAKYKEIRPSTIGLSRGQDEEFDLIEGVGERWNTDELKQMASVERGQDNRTYRVIDPFASKSFEVYPAFTTVRFFCLKSHSLTRPRTYQLRAFFLLDTFEIKLKLPDYNLISTDKRQAFEKEVKKLTRRFTIET